MASLGASQAQPGHVATEMQKCTPFSGAPLGKDAGSLPAVSKTRDVFAPPATRQRGQDTQRLALKPAEPVDCSVSDAPSPIRDQTRCGSSPRAEEAIQAEPGRVLPHSTGHEAPGIEQMAPPKSPAAAGTARRGGEASPAKEAPAASLEQAGGGTPSLKRKLEAPEEALTPSGKRALTRENCHPRPSFPSQLQPFPTAPVPKVPPLRVKEPLAPVQDKRWFQHLPLSLSLLATRERTYFARGWKDAGIQPADDTSDEWEGLFWDSVWERKALFRRPLEAQT